MIWVIWPQMTKRRLASDSSTLALLDMARKFTEAGDLVYFCLPPHAAPAVEDESDRLRVVVVEDVPSFMAGAALVPAALGRLFSRSFGLYPCDAFLTTRPLAIPGIKAMLAEPDGEVPVVYWEPGLEDKLARWRAPWMRAALATGIAESCPIFLTQKELALARRLMVDYAPWASKSLDDRATVVGVGLKVERLRQVMEEWPKLDGDPVVLYGGRINRVKQTSKLIRVVDRVYRAGHRLRLMVTTPGKINPRMFKGFPKEVFENDYATLVVGCDRETYYRVAAQADVGISMSLREGFPVGFWEQLYLGVVVLLPDRDWVRGFVPDWYPFVYGVKNEELALHEMLVEVLEDIEGARAKARFPELREWIESRVSERHVADQVRHVGLSLVEREAVRTFGDADELMEDALGDMPREFTLTEYVERVASMARMFPLSPEARARTFVHPSNYNMYRFLVDMGYEPVRFEGKDVVLAEVSG